jgi:hypothetical protein
VLASDTDAQKQFMEQHPGMGLLYEHNDAESLASQIEVLYNDRELLKWYKKNSLWMAQNVVNWEQESEILLSEINSIIVKKP